MAEIGRNIHRAIELLNQSEIVGIPTETVYGLAGNAYNTEAVMKIFCVKNRPSFDPLIVHTYSVEKMKEFTGYIPQSALDLFEKFAPGPLTILLPKTDRIPDLVTSGLERVAVRIPNHELTLELLKNLDYPLAAPSANPFGYISPTSAQHVDNQLGDQLKYVLDGGECNVGIESTIIGFSDDIPIIYRKGGLAINEIKKVVGKLRIQSHSSSNPKAPGMLKSHYSPRKPFSILPSNLSVDRIKNVGYLGFSEYHPNISKENQLILSPTGDFKEAARNLFAYMRKLDVLPVDEIFTELLPERDLGIAINDRLRRATVK